jgi:hypothetical protein
MGDYRFTGSLSAPVPDGWFAKESLTVLAPDGLANVIASSEPLDKTLTTQQYADGQGEDLRNMFANFKERSYGPANMLGGRECVVRRFEWSPPDRGNDPVTQIQVYHVAAGRGYTLTATARSVRFEAVERVLIGILEGVLISGGNPEVQEAQAATKAP